MHPRRVMVTLKVVPEQAAPEVDLEVWAAPHEGVRSLLQCGKPDWGPQNGGKAEHHREQPSEGGGVDFGGIIEGDPVLLGMSATHAEASPRVLRNCIRNKIIARTLSWQSHPE